MHFNYIQVDRTPEEFNSLRNKGLTIAAIAKEFNVSYCKLYSWMHEHDLVGITNRSDSLDRRILKSSYIRMKENLYSDERIAEIYGTNPRNLHRWKVRNNIPMMRVKGTLGRTVEHYKELKRQGYNDIAVREEWGCAASTLTKWKKENGLI